MRFSNIGAPALRHPSTKPGPVLERNRCACGKAAPAKVLIQHGKCHACQMADRVAKLHDGDLDILRHMLGAGESSAGKPGHRNHYLCNVQDRAAMEHLVAAGLVVHSAVQMTTQYYHSTRAGCRAAGLDAAAQGARDGGML